MTACPPLELQSPAQQQAASKLSAVDMMLKACAKAEHRVRCSALA